MDSMGVLSAEEKQIQPCSPFQPQFPLNRHCFMVCRLPTPNIFHSNCNNGMSYRWYALNVIIRFPISWHLRCNRELCIPLDSWKGEILINVLSTPLWNTWLVLETRWMNWYIGNGLRIRWTWLTKARNVLMIKSIHVCESAQLLRGGGPLKQVVFTSKAKILPIAEQKSSFIHVTVNIRNLMSWQCKNKFTLGSALST